MSKTGGDYMFVNIDAERARHKVSQEQLAKTLGVSTSTFKNWMRGKTDIPASKLAKMADFFGVTCDYLLGREPPGKAS